MKRTNNKDYTETVFAYLCDSVYDFDGTRAETARHIWERFDSEYNYVQNQRRIPNLQERVAEWLSGLALNTAYTYADIIALAEKWHECELTESQKDMVCENWFKHLAMNLLRLWRKEGVL